MLSEQIAILLQPIICARIYPCLRACISTDRISWTDSSLLVLAAINNPLQSQMTTPVAPRKSSASKEASTFSLTKSFGGFAQPAFHNFGLAELATV
jgi:hypothetical protein